MKSIRHLVKKDFIFVLLLIFISICLFIPLYYPQKLIMVTPEMVGSDNIKFHFPNKYFIKDSLSNNKIPIWNNHIGGGFPFLAQPENGVFNPINFLTLKFFSFSSAIIFQYYLVFCLLSIFSFYLGRQLLLNNFSSLFFSITFTYSALFIFNSIHISHMFSILYFPLVLIFFLRFLDNRSIRHFLFLVFSISLQILSGHLQYSFITFVFIIFFILIKSFFEKRILWQISLYIFLAYLMSICLTGFQTLPSIEFFLNSTRGNQEIFGNLGKYSSNVPFSIILTFLSPFVLGEIKKGTYPLDNLLAPWDGNLYIGFYGLFFLILFLKNIKFITKLRKSIKSLLKIFFTLFCVFFILSFGNNSPLYFIFYFPPFNFFRAHSRFFFIVVFILSYFASLSFYQVFKKNKKKYLVFLIILIIVIEKYYLFYRFHGFKEFSSLFLSHYNLNSQRIFNSLSFNLNYFKLLSNLGYDDEKKLNLFSELIQETRLSNYNLITNQEVLNIESGIKLARHSLFLNEIENMAFFLKNDGKISSLSGASKNLLAYAAVDKVSSLVPYNDFSLNFLSLENEYQSKYYPKIKFYIYKVNNTKGIVQFYRKFIKIKTLKEFKSVINTLDLSETALVESDFDHKLLEKITDKKDFNFSYSVIKNEDNQIKIKVESSDEGILSIPYIFYPGWEAKINGKKTKIYRTNFLFQGIFLPKGNHTIDFFYNPKSFVIGFKLSAFTLFLIFIFLFLKAKFF